MTIKRATGFELVYGAQERMPLNNSILVYRFIHEEHDVVVDPIMERIVQLVELDEMRSEDTKRNGKLKQQMKYLFD